MSAVSRFARKMLFLIKRRKFQSELEEEMAFHCAEAEKELADQGMAGEEAHYAAMRRFGNATRLKETSEEIVAFRWETVLQDARFALRQLSKNPGFGLMAVLILALGMSVSITIFSFVDAALIQPLPYVHPDRLVDVAESAALIRRSNLSRADYEDWRRMTTTLSSLEAWGYGSFLLKADGATERIAAVRVGDGIFRTFGVKPILGRDFLPGEDSPGGGKVVLLLYSTWQRRFGGRADVIGQSMNLDDQNYTIIGVLPKGFVFGPRGNGELWVPLGDKSDCEQRRSCHNLFAVGRLRDGVSIDAARAEFKRIAAELAKQYPGSNKGQGAYVQPLSELIVGDVRPMLLTLLAGAGLLLLIACMNVASLLLVRSASRRREIAVRGALGATPTRLVRQFVTEGLLLAVAGSASGTLLAYWMMTIFVGQVPKRLTGGMPFLQHVGLNAHTLLFALGVASIAAMLLAATPALQLTRTNIHDALSEGGRGAAGRFWQRLGANLVVMELTVAVVLLTGAGLLGRSFYKLLHVETGFDPTHLATVTVQAPKLEYKTIDQTNALLHEIQRRLSAVPGVESVGMTSVMPLQCNCNTDWIRIAGKPFHGEHNEVDERDVSPAYLDTLKAKLVRGRMLTESDDAKHPYVAVINETLAKKYFPGEDPIGKMIGDGDLAPDSMRRVVGVIRDVRESSLDEDIWPAEYLPMFHAPDNYFGVVVRTALDDKAFLPALVSTLHQIDPNLGVYGAETMQEQTDASPTAMFHRFATWLVGAFAAMALVLGVVGLYGVIAYSVGQRTREIGVRMALGAQRTTVYSMVMRQALGLTAFGIGFGIVCSIGASLLMRKLLFGVEAWDMPTLAGVALVLGAASLLACFIPARRAASVNPTEALRAE